MEKVDRRITKTKKAILHAYLSLLQTKGADSISVSDITKRADINRATFYAHYKDKYELLEQSIKEVIDDLEKAIEMQHEDQETFSLKTLEKIFEGILTNIFKHEKFYTVMLGKNGPTIFSEKLQEIFYEKTVKGLMTVHPEGEIDLLVSKPIYLSYVTSAQFGVTKYWIKNNYMESPIFMAKQLLMLYKLGGARVAEYKE
ncbi:TetR/AcrR family transcriptional regulator [Niallia taxi]|nr:TetR/AcrR family transcriptional regulator [Niallia taxi]MDE5053288.1 TetR/AcrR family transcriptional regulator [Niallia taxi]